jgi:hypothetical protein
MRESMENLPMGNPVEAEEIEYASPIELVSSYIDSYYSLDPDSREARERELAARGLPLPRMPSDPPVHTPRRVTEAIDKETFLDYVLLIYTGTALFYSWIFMAIRFAKRDFKTKHRLIQTAISLFYILSELILLDQVMG